MTVQNDQGLNPDSNKKPDDIDKIMNEIEELQKEMAAVTERATLSSNVTHDLPPSSSSSSSALSSTSTSSTEDVPSESAHEDHKPLSSIHSSSSTTGNSGGNSGRNSVKGHVQAQTQAQATLSAHTTASSVPLSVSQSESSESESEPESEEPWVSETLAHLKSSQREASVASLSEHSIAITVNGTTTVKLNYENSAEFLHVRFSPDDVHIQFPNGTELKIPHQQRKALKAA